MGFNTYNPKAVPQILTRFAMMLWRMVTIHAG